MTMATKLGSAMAILAMTACVAGCEKEGLSSTPGGCSYGGKTYRAGVSFPAADGCNSCQCAANGQVDCTLMACLGDASPPTADVATGADLGADSASILDTAGTKHDTPGGGNDLDPARDVGADVILTVDLALDGKPAVDLAVDLRPPADARDAGKDATVTCAWLDASIPAGQSVSDGCNTCACSDTGTMMCTARACPPADAAPSCALTVSLAFGYDGGLVAYQDQYALDPTVGMTISRTYYRGLVDGSSVRTCSPPLPPCGAAGVVSAATIVADLAAADVKPAFKAGSTPVYGTDPRPMDGAVWSITVAGSGTILVGGACQPTTASTCVAIPAGVQRLADDLKSLASTAAAATACAGL